MIMLLNELCDKNNTGFIKINVFPFKSTDSANIKSFYQKTYTGIIIFKQAH
ncbi:hypothetical protein CHU_0812 [Cytophaga hutchinsonii ATCC 33406]|uniref:Uncharacterized protein n=1 Tax=Cytophaga hutchinsonii (strain ATCC 33406 / DSM 1761 / CIP 103989 / NBRC 15051 / NCIMB 9469 / D465) TaxID=269798 RepID=A0A6N4SP44_CYTH3|nr:hypothetical protein CHU_0812 [Cytophaga hutchinsonii ATCC 33406]